MGIADSLNVAIRALDLRRRLDPCRREPEPFPEDLPLGLFRDDRRSGLCCFRREEGLLLPPGLREADFFREPPGLLDRDLDLDFLRVPPGLLEADWALLGDGGRKLASCCRWQRSPYWQVPCKNFWQISGMQPGRIREALGDLGLAFAFAFITRGEAER